MNNEITITLADVISEITRGRAQAAAELARCRSLAMEQAIAIADGHLELLRQLQDALGGDLRLDGQDPIKIRRDRRITRSDQPFWMDEAMRLACASARTLAWHRSEPK